MSTPEITTALRSLLREKVHIQPGTLARLPSHEAARLRSPLDLGRLLLAPLERAPVELLRFWADHPRGHAVINPLRHDYRPGVQPVGRREYDGVAWVAARRLLAEPGLACPLASLLDHLLGSDGQPAALRLSDGAGRSAAWAEVGPAHSAPVQPGLCAAGGSRDASGLFRLGIARVSGRCFGTGCRRSRPGAAAAHQSVR